MPRYVFIINGQRHAFDGPDLATTQRFANQWAAHQTPPTLGGIAHQFFGGVGDFVNQTLGDLSKTPNDFQGGEGEEAALGDILHPRGAVARAGVAGAKNAFRPRIPSITPPSNEAERLIRVAAAMAPNAFGGEVGLLPRIVRVLVPAATSEGARAATQALGGDDTAQAIASLVGGFAGGHLTGLKAPPPETRAGIIEPPVEPPIERAATPVSEAAIADAGGAHPPTNVVSLGAARQNRPVEVFNHTATEPARGTGGATVSAFRPRPQVEAPSRPPPFDPKSAGPPMDHAAAVEALSGERIGLTPGQKAGGPGLLAEDQALIHPSTGPALRRARLSAQADLNRALANRSLAPIGETIPNKVKLGDQTIAYIQSRLDDAVGRAGENLYVHADPDYFKKEMEILTDAYEGHSPEVYRRLETIGNNLRNKLNSNDYNQDSIKNIFADLDALTYKYHTTFNTEANYIGDQVQKFKGAVGDLAGREDPNYLAVSKAAEQGRANLGLMRGANSHAISPRAGFSVANLKRAYAEKVDDPESDVAVLGGPEMFNLVKNAETVMSSKIPRPFPSEKTGKIRDENAFKLTDPATAPDLTPQTNALQPAPPSATIVSLAARRAANPPSADPAPAGPGTE